MRDRDIARERKIYSERERGIAREGKRDSEREKER